MFGIRKLDREFRRLTYAGRTIKRKDIRERGTLCLRHIETVELVNVDTATHAGIDKDIARGQGFFS
ncbi:hypothetical protein [Burkholderia sp. LMG 21824]|uniref:hypothetical protein n=1 Tax=Burkholderia sp. LMG 21824 TaxID=3158172 RepID=UPI003C2B4B7C